jgi:hypothetical protein
MRKILLAVNAYEAKTSAIDFGCYIANLTRSPLTGIFLEHKKASTETLVSAGTRGYETALPPNIATNINIFCDRCLRNDASHSVHHVQGNPLHEMVKESLYADIILTDGNTSFNEHEGWPSQFVKELLENAKCPVIITPFDFDEINEVVFAYDGTDSSIFAMKQFIYLFPEFTDVQITVLQVLKSEDDDITEKEKLKELLMMYYSSVHYDTLHGNAQMELFKNFIGKRNKLLVSGAYGRKKVFNRSTADFLLKTLNIPIFITHY